MSAIDEREQLIRIDLMLADIAMRQEQLRQLKSFEPWRVERGHRRPALDD